ncbi:MAG: hypothetical protein JWN40_79 [Phycisphaerales bacterium]|nr:hypothetical protein [Phycisphaerales bacterium]
MIVIMEDSRTGVILPVAACLTVAFIGNDWITLPLRPLRYLEVPFPNVLYATSYLAPIAGAVLWLAFRRRWRVPSVVAGLLLPWVIVYGVLGWAGHQVEKVPTTTWVEGNDLPALEARLGFKVWEEGDASGKALWVARRPGYATSLAAEVRRMGIARP